MSSPEQDPQSTKRRRLLLYAAEGALLAVLFGFMLWTRLRSLDGLTRDGTLYFVGTDPYYHLRNVLVLLHHFPQVLAFDPWTYYPLGTASGQFGTLFDVIIAGVLLLVGGGAPPDMETVRLGVAVYPAVLGALTVVPVWLLARQAGGRIAGAWAAIAIAFISGEFLVRSLAGYFDHHVAEALFSTLALAAFLFAARTAHAHRDTLASLWNPFPGSLAEARERLAEAERRPLLTVAGTGVLAGLALAAYLLVWNYGVLFVAILDLALLVQFTTAHLRDHPTSHTSTAAIVTFLTAGVVLLPAGWGEGMALHRVSLLQPALLVLSTLGVVVLQGLDATVRARDLPHLSYPGLAAGAGAVGVVVVALVLPDLLATLRSGLVWITGIDAGSGVSTIAETRPTRWSGLVDQHGYLLIPALAGLAVMAWEAARRPRTTPALLLAWGVVITAAAYNQVRFNYYMSVVVAVLNGVLLARVATWTGFTRSLQRLVHGEAPGDGERSRRRGRHTKAPKQGTSVPLQVGAVALVALFLLPGLVVPTQAQPFQAWKVGENMRPGEEAQWRPELHWLRDNTPAVPGFSLTETYDGPLAMSEERYGVLSWWDYGHWIQLMGERPPVANPFQQAAPFASEYFTNPPNRSLELLEEWEGEGFVRYVMIDDAMATGKFGAITVWAEADHLLPSREDASSVTTITYPDGSERRVLQMPDPYRDSMMYHLYERDANGLEHYRLVREAPQIVFVGSVASLQGNPPRTLCFHQTFPSASCRVTPVDSMEAQRAIQRGEPFPVRALGGGNAVGLAYNVQVTSTLKTFERVEGAVLTGEAPAGSTVTANVTMQQESTRSFVYQRSVTVGESGTYELRVSYATGPPSGEAGRDVVSRGPYTLHVDPPNGPERSVQVQVPDEAVLEGREVQVPSTNPSP